MAGASRVRLRAGCAARVCKLGCKSQGELRRRCASWVAERRVSCGEGVQVGLRIAGWVARLGVQVGLRTAAGRGWSEVPAGSGWGSRLGWGSSGSLLGGLLVRSRVGRLAAAAHRDEALDSFGAGLGGLGLLEAVEDREAVGARELGEEDGGLSWSRPTRGPGWLGVLAAVVGPGRTRPGIQRVHQRRTWRWMILTSGSPSVHFGRSHEEDAAPPVTPHRAPRLGSLGLRSVYAFGHGTAHH